MHSTPPPEPPTGPRLSRPGRAPTREECTWATVAHAGSFVAAWFALGVLAPLTVMLVRGKESAFVRHHAVESLNFQLNALFWTAVGLVLVIVLVGVAVLAVVGVWYVVLVVLASIRARDGEWYRYPLIVRLIR